TADVADGVVPSLRRQGAEQQRSGDVRHHVEPHRAEPPADPVASVRARKPARLRVLPAHHAAMALSGVPVVSADAWAGSLAATDGLPRAARPRHRAAVRPVRGTTSVPERTARVRRTRSEARGGALDLGDAPRRMRRPRDVARDTRALRALR